MKNLNIKNRPGDAFGYLRSGLVRGMLVVGLFSCFINVLMLTTPIYMLQMFDRVLSSRNLDTLILLTVIAAFALLTLAALMIVRSAALIRIGAWFDQQISSAALTSAISAATKNGKVPSSRILADLNSVRGFFERAAIIPLFDAPWSPIFILIIFFLSPMLGAVALVGLLLMLGLAVGHDHIVTLIANKSRTLSRPAREQAKTLLRNADTAKSMGMVSTLVGAWSERNSDAHDFQAGKHYARAVYSAITQLVTQGLRVAMLCAGAILVIQNNITTGVMLASAILASRAIAPMTKLVKARRSVIDAHKAYKRLRSDLESAPAKTFWDGLYLSRGSLCVQQVGFRYTAKSSTKGLRNLSVELEPGEMLCVVGPSGSGKSTFAKLVVGILHPRSGQVRLGGAPIEGLAPDIRAAQIGYLPPDLQLFDGTIHENISRMRLGVKQSVIEAAQMAGVHDAIMSLPRGYDTEIGSEELSLSPGERQLISLSRAVFGSPRLVVLDEPTFNLDKSNERNLVKLIRALKNQGTIVVVVSHRANILRCADQVLMMPSGKITAPDVQKNTHLKVLDNKRNHTLAGTTRREDA